jgi:membrane protease YdiL (CAAX protease family)
VLPYVLAASLAGLFGAGLALGGEAATFASSGLVALPFAGLGLLAHLGQSRLWARIGALLWLVLLLGVGAVALIGLGAVSLGVTELAPEAVPLARLLGVVLLVPAACLLGALAAVGPVRRRLARVLPIDPASFAHAVALALVAGLGLASFVPLVVTGSPSLLALLALDTTGELASGATLRQDLYGLIWLMPAALVAVGLGVTRGPRAALTRLGLVRPTRGQVGLAVGLAFAMLGAVFVLDAVIGHLWASMGWARTDGRAIEKLMAYAFSPLGALVVGVSAGLGEEVAVRGVLQPRLGILLPNLLFTGMHALQYNWDALIVVFAAGVVLGVLRRRTNTTTAAVAHGTYDALLFGLSAAGLSA